MFCLGISPVQLFPLPTGVGLLHSLICSRNPTPHSTLHSPTFVQSLQSPWAFCSYLQSDQLVMVKLFIWKKVLYSPTFVDLSNKLIPEHTSSIHFWPPLQGCVSFFEQRHWPVVLSHMVPSFLLPTQDLFLPHLHFPSKGVSPGGHCGGSLSHMN